MPFLPLVRVHATNVNWSHAPKHQDADQTHAKFLINLNATGPFPQSDQGPLFGSHLACVVGRDGGIGQEASEGTGQLYNGSSLHIIWAIFF